MSEYILNTNNTYNMDPYYNRNCHWMKTLNTPMYPTTSTAVQLDPLIMSEVIKKFTLIAPIKNALSARKINNLSYICVANGLARNKELQIEIKYTNMNEYDFRPTYTVQGSVMKNIEEALSYINLIIEKAKIISKVDIVMEINELNIFNQLMQPILDSDKCCLTHLNIRRRYCGQKLPLVVKLIQKNDKTLKEVKRIGLSEAVECFNENINLDSLSIMNFDMVNNGDFEGDELNDRSREIMIKLGESGATFSHLSYTTYTGFDLSNPSIITMLKSCCVKSLRITMQKGSPISTCLYTQSLLDDLLELELVGELVKPTGDLNILFPNLKHFLYSKQNLAHGTLN
uniref:F-box domain-containing protein n=1 Tax=Parastrongyloides trichosuri TaxID=131310 RepID=A0A0N4ZQW4_PARTI